MTKLYLSSLLLLLCLAAVCLPGNEPVAFPISRLVNWLCLAWFAQGVWDQIKTEP